jgi:maltose O-acetyltransferase
MHNSRLEIGRRTYVNRDCVFEGNGRIVIGEGCSIGPQSMFISSDHDTVLVDGRLIMGPEVPRDVVIGPRVWIGARATLLPGSSVEGDAIIAAGAVVTGHLEAGYVYGGVPARKLRAQRPGPRASGPVIREA